MTSTTARQAKRTALAGSQPGALPRMRRRPAVAVATLAAAALGSVGIAWVWSSTTAATQVVVVTTDVPRGAVIEAGDVNTARITLDPLLKPIAASRLREVVGQRAATGLTAGGIVTESMLEPETVPEAGRSLVPVALPAEQALGLDLEVGDHVKVVMTAPDGQDPEGNPPFTVADVAGVDQAPDTGGTVVALTVPVADGPVLAARVASGNFYLVLDSREVN